MRTILITAAGCLVIAGCVAGGPVQPGATRNAAPDTPFPPASTAPTPPPAAPDLSPKFIQPVTGGPPVIALPLGGNFYLPVTGEPPVTGIPLN